MILLLLPQEWDTALPALVETCLSAISHSCTLSNWTAPKDWQNRNLQGSNIKQFSHQWTSFASAIILRHQYSACKCLKKHISITYLATVLEFSLCLGGMQVCLKILKAHIDNNGTKKKKKSFFSLCKTISQSLSEASAVWVNQIKRRSSKVTCLVQNWWMGSQRGNKKTNFEGHSRDLSS